MERLTSEINGRAVPIKFDLDFAFDMPQHDWSGLQEMFDRLAAYEETGLEPEELAQAKKEGRLVVLPCSIGDPVFMGTGRYKITGYEEDVCDGFYIGRDGVLQVKAQNYNGNHGTYGVIGQTAELTREAAEAALEEMEAEYDTGRTTIGNSRLLG